MNTIHQNLFSRLVVATLIVFTFTASTAFAQRGRRPAKTPPVETATVLNPISESIQAFSFQLYKQLASEAKSDDNLFFSPVSIHVTLGMTANGAAGETEKQMLAVLQLPAFGKNETDAFRSLMQSIGKKSNDYQLSIANRLWGEKNFSFLPAFLNTTRSAFLAELQTMDFRSNSESARTEINQWVEKQTQDKIKNLLPAGSVSSTTRLVLTNAVYFKGNWQDAFKKEATQNMPFLTKESQKANPASAKKVPLMFREGDFSYYAADSYQAISLPYEGGRIEMLVVLPEEVEGLAELEKKLESAFFGEIVKNLSQKKVKLWLPKFKLEASYDMNATLETMGMPDAFSAAEADFSGMTGGRDLFLSKVFHKSFVEVNEEGTEAAAATGAVMMLRAMPMPREETIFRADHPFLFAIRDKETGAVLFLGRVVNP